MKAIFDGASAQSYSERPNEVEDLGESSSLERVNVVAFPSISQSPILSMSIKLDCPAQQ